MVHIRLQAEKRRDELLKISRLCGARDCAECFGRVDDLLTRFRHRGSRGWRRLTCDPDSVVRLDRFRCAGPGCFGRGAMEAARRRAGRDAGVSGGALSAAMAFEVFEKSFQHGGHLISGAGLISGAAVSIVTDVLIRRVRGGASGEAGMTLFAVVVLDGVPENLALGTAVAAGGGSIATVVGLGFCAGAGVH
jgi:hypothetical protein